MVLLIVVGVDGLVVSEEEVGVDGLVVIVVGVDGLVVIVVAEEVVEIECPVFFQNDPKLFL